MTVGRLMGAAITTAATTVALWVLGLEALFALSAGVLIGTIVIAASLRDSEAAPELQDETTAAWRGSAVSRLAWGFNPRTDVAGEIVARRVRALLRRRLARLGIDIDDPAQTARVDAAIGDGIWDRLCTRTATRADIERALDRIERRDGDRS